MLTLKMTDLARRTPPIYANVDVAVVDVNDSPPKFIDTPTSVQVSESAAIGSKMFTVTTVDPDAGPGGLNDFALKVSTFTTPAGLASHTNELCRACYDGRYCWGCSRYGLSR